MATQAGASDFTNNLGKIYGIYTGGFFAFVVSSPSSSSRRAGSRHRLPLRFFTLAVYASSHVSRTMQVSEYYVAGRAYRPSKRMATARTGCRRRPSIGMAARSTRSAMMRARLCAGLDRRYVLVAVLVAPYLRKFGAYNRARLPVGPLRGNFARFLGIIVCSPAPSLCGGADRRHRPHRQPLIGMDSRSPSMSAFSSSCLLDARRMRAVTGRRSRSISC